MEKLLHSRQSVSRNQFTFKCESCIYVTGYHKSNYPTIEEICFDNNWLLFCSRSNCKLWYPWENNPPRSVYLFISLSRGRMFRILVEIVRIPFFFKGNFAELSGVSIPVLRFFIRISEFWKETGKELMLFHTFTFEFWMVAHSF